MDEEEQKYIRHETSESIDPGKHGKDYEFEFGAFLLLRLISQRKTLKNFRMTREKKGTGKFDDFIFAYDTHENEEKFSLIQLKYLMKENKKINYEDLACDSKSKFFLPYYFDYYNESLEHLSNDRDLKEAELENLMFCTNINLDDNLGFITKEEVSNELFKNSGSLYKINVEDQEMRFNLFHEQFLSESKGLANELAKLVMANKEIEIDIKSIINSDSFSLIKSFYEMIEGYVFDIKKNKFKESFLARNIEEQNSKLNSFRSDFFDSCAEFAEKRNVFSLTGNEEIIKFLKFKEIKFRGNPRDNIIQSIANELVLSIMLKKCLNLKSIIQDKRYLQKFNIIIKDHVIDTITGRLKETFLNSSSNISEVKDLREYFIMRLKRFYSMYRNRSSDYEKLVNLCSFQADAKSSNSLHEIFEKYRTVDDLIQFLPSMQIQFKIITDDTEMLDIFPSCVVNVKEVDAKIKQFLSLLTFVVNKINYKKLVRDEIELLCNNEDVMSISEGFIKYIKNWHDRGVSSLLCSFDSKLKYRDWITEQDLLEKLMNSNILFQNNKVKFSKICNKPELINAEAFLYVFSEDEMTIGKDITENVTKFHNATWIDRSLQQNKNMDS